MVTLKLQVNNSWLGLDINQNQDLELTYKTMDAEGIDTLCSNYTTSFALPRTANNISILSPLFKIQTIYTAVTFDLYGKSKAVLGINGQDTIGYLSIDSIGESFNVTFRSGMSLAIEALEGKMIADIIPVADTLAFDLSAYDSYNNYWGEDGSRNVNTYWDNAKKRWTNALENYYYFFAPKSNDATISQLYFKPDSNRALTIKYRTCNDDGQNVENSGLLTPFQLCLCRSSDLRCGVKVSYVAQLILESLGYPIVYDSVFFDVRNKYHSDAFMTLAQKSGTEGKPLSTFRASQWMPDITQKDYLVSFLKLWGLYLYFDGQSIHIDLRSNYYKTANPLAIDSFVNHDTITIRTNDDYGKVRGQLECSCAAMGDLFASAQDTTATMNGTPDADSVNIYEGSCFKTAPMLYYVGPMSFPMWRNVNKPTFNMIAQSKREKLTLIDSEDGGELITPGMNGYKGDFTLFNADISAPDDNLFFYPPTNGYLECEGIWKQYPKMLIADSWNNSLSMCPANDSILYNYQTKQVAPLNDLKNGGIYHQGFFYDTYQLYVNEITNKGNIIIECEATLTPQYIELMKKCNLLITLDNVACRIKQFVVNLAGKCKLVLQKITNPSALTSGQDEFGPYFHTPEPLFFANNTTGLKATGIKSNMTSITGTVQGSGGVGTISNNGKSAALSAVTLPTFPAYSGQDNVPQAAQSRITYHAPELQEIPRQDVFRIPANGYADILEGEYMGTLYVTVSETPITVKSRYFNMPEGWTTMLFNNNGGIDVAAPYYVIAKDNGELIISARGNTRPAYTCVLGFYTGGLAAPIFATCEIAINQ